MIKLAVSVIICTHNPRRDYLERTLTGLRAQTLPTERWELILIDNASKEPLAVQWDLSWHPHSRHIREEKLGLTAARLRGIKESEAELLVFVDDDNVLQPDYLDVVLSLACEHAKVGCFGAGLLEPEFEQEPTPELKPYVGGLALRSVAFAQWSNVPTDAITPWGAGLAVRRIVADRYLAEVQECSLRKELDRSGSTLNSGGDDEFYWVSCEMGFGKGLFPALKVTHLIDRKRVQREYLLALKEGFGFSHTFLARLHGLPGSSPPPMSTVADILSNVLRAKLSLTLYHAHSWWFGRSKPAIEKAFDEAWREGVDRARRRLVEMGQL